MQLSPSLDPLLPTSASLPLPAQLWVWRSVGEARWGGAGGAAALVPKALPASPRLRVGSPRVLQTQTGRISTRPPSRANSTPWTSTRCCGRHSAASAGSGRHGGAPAPRFCTQKKKQKTKKVERERDEVFKKKKKEKNLFYNQYLRRTGRVHSIRGSQAGGSPWLAPAINKCGCPNSSAASSPPS